MIHHRPQGNQDSREQFHSELPSELSNFAPDLVIGDFNTNLMKPNWVTRLMEKLNFEQRVKSVTTNESTLLDGVFVRKDFEKYSHTIVLDEVFSFHRPIFCKIGKQ